MFVLKIKQYRKKKKITQKKLSKLSGLAQGYISNLESDKRCKSPTLNTLETIANVLEVCPRDLVECNCKYCKSKKKKL
ncbi:helix-turn-helix domain-containing protein [Clostridium felsineum]|uniref:helix-turn-helix domain-containing protein n=1 Tax=Clostridium felsineum TaxID=36839 RepID=UPI00098CAA1F|nr:helix-turn-helix transcriptional regulator [Clostridium felsineum]URZ15295.1 hypothetical protein CLFE_013130 [Clostridium felsineum DSM 794]